MIGKRTKKEVVHKGTDRKRRESHGHFSAGFYKKKKNGHIEFLRSSSSRRRVKGWCLIVFDSGFYIDGGNIARTNSHPKTV